MELTTTRKGGRVTKNNEAGIVDRFLRLKQRIELLGGTLVVVKARGKLAPSENVFLSTIGGGPGIDNVVYKDLDEVEKYLPDIEKSREIRFG